MDNAHKRKATSDKAANPDNAHTHFNSTEAQRKRLMDWLRVHRMIDTIKARRDLDIMMPAARVHELRHKLGYEIDLVWIEQPTDSGKLHRVGLYVLKEGEVKNG